MTYVKLLLKDNKKGYRGMKLKNLLLGLVLTGFTAVQLGCFAAQVSDSTIRVLVNKYKAGNYLGCIQFSDTILKDNPSNIFALYYKGLAYSQLGKKEEAIEALEKVKTLNTNPQLTSYAERGLACINGTEACKAEETSEMDAFIKSNKFYDKAVQSEVNKKRLDRIKENINDELNPKKSDASNNMPTNDEIANAVKTLAKVGINPMANQLAGLYQNPEMMQMNMLLGNNNNQNNSMNMLPLLMMNQNGNQNISPEIIQTMMMSQMAPEFGTNTY